MTTNKINTTSINQADIIKEALKYISLGFSVIPLGTITKDESGRKNIEYPKDGWTRYQERIATEAEIYRWDCKNLGIACGIVSGLLVLDLDLYKENFNKELLDSFDLPQTPTQQTASGGQQLFFKLPKDLAIRNAVCIGTKDSGIDVRGEGGMVIVPPSTTLYGDYKWVISPFDVPLAEIPPKLLKLLRGDPNNNLKTKKTLPELINLKEGEGRNNAMASLIGKLLLTTTKDCWDAEVWPVAQEVNLTYKPPLPNDELLSIYKSITKTEMERKIKLAGETGITPFPSALTHAELMAKSFPPARYTIEPFFEQGTMNMVSAPPNTWKSWLLFLFASHIVAGTSVFDKFKTEKTGVMIVNEEDSQRLVQDRLKLLKITSASLPIYYRIAQGLKLKTDFVDSLIKEAKEKNIGVIMFDSLRAVHEADENDSNAMQGVMDLFKKLTREDVTVIFTHHHKKKNAMGRNDDAEITRGSTAINAAISGHILLEEVIKGGERYLIVKHLKSKVGEKLHPFDIGINTNDGVSFQYLGDHQPKEQALSEAKTKIINELQNRTELLGRKDFIYLKIGGATTIKEATKNLVQEGLIKLITRKDAEIAGLKTFGPGKSNEILYFINKEADEASIEFNGLFSEEP